MGLEAAGHEEKDGGAHSSTHGDKVGTLTVAATCQYPNGKGQIITELAILKPELLVCKGGGEAVWREGEQE